MTIADIPQNNIISFPSGASVASIERRYDCDQDCMCNLLSIINLLGARLDEDGSFDRDWLVIELKVNLAALKYLFGVDAASPGANAAYENRRLHHVNNMIKLAQLLGDEAFDLVIEEEVRTTGRGCFVSQLRQEYRELDAVSMGDDCTDSGWRN
jgi:hypothetical protein